MNYKERVLAAELRTRIAQHDQAFRYAEQFLKTVDEKVLGLYAQIEALEKSVEPMKAKSRRASTLKTKNKRALAKLHGKANQQDKLIRYKRKIRELEREIAQG